MTMTKPSGSNNIADIIKSNRNFLKADRWEDWKINGLLTDQRKKLPQPALQKPYSNDSVLIDLIPEADFSVGQMSLLDALRLRRSHRDYTSTPFTREEISFLLWATQGVKEVPPEGTSSHRTVPSGGARHPFETYILVRGVEEIEPGLYRYLAFEHKLCLVNKGDGIAEKIYDACMQGFVKKAAVVFIWTTIPYRMEYRYSFLAHKIIAQETGHICQNLYLACETIGAGACALGTYRQKLMDMSLGVNGEDEFAIYIASAGKIE